MERGDEERRLAAILSADVVGYSRLMGVDESGTLARLKTHRVEIIDPKIAGRHGRIVKLMGDGVLVEFASVVNAVQCAADIQRAMADRNADVAEAQRIELRIGINLGDIIVDGDDIHGDGVNVAARLQEMAEPGGTCVSGVVFDAAKDKLDVGFKDLGPQALKNIAEPVRAYRMLPKSEAAVIEERAATRSARPRRAAMLSAVAVVVVAVAAGVLIWQEPWVERVEPASVEQMAFPLPDKPSIAVLPFANMSDEPGQEWFVDGMTDDLITDLSQISGLFVIARNSSFQYKGQVVDVKTVAEQLGVKYVLEGSVRRAGDQVRINAQLIDAITGGHVWAERYDGRLEDIFALQDKVTRQIVAAMAVELTPEEERSAVVSETDSTEAYEAFLRGWEHYRRFTPEDFATAVVYLTRAIELDPEYGRAHAALARTYQWATDLRWLDALSLSNPEAFAKEGESHRLALKYGPTSLGYQAESWRFSHLFGVAFEGAVPTAQRAIILDPNDPEGFVTLAHAFLHAGRPAEAAEVVETAMRLDPHYPPRYLSWLGLAKFHLEEFEEAATLLEKQSAFSSALVNDAFAPLVAAYAYLGRGEDARGAIERWTKRQAENSGRPPSLAFVRMWGDHMKAAGYMDRVLDGLRKAALPE